MRLLLMLLPAVAWGVLPLVVAKLGGRPVNQIFGTAVGTLLASVVVFLVAHPSLDAQSAVLAGLAGAFGSLVSSASIRAIATWVFQKQCRFRRAYNWLGRLPSAWSSLVNGRPLPRS